MTDLEPTLVEIEESETEVVITPPADIVVDVPVPIQTSVKILPPPATKVEIGPIGLAGPQGPQGPPGADGEGGTSLDFLHKLSDVVPANSAKTIDLRPLLDFDSLLYLINYKNTLNGVSKSLKMIVNKNDLGILNQVFGKIGSIINVGIDTLVDDDDMKLVLTNNENYDMAVTFIRSEF